MEIGSFYYVNVLNPKTVLSGFLFLRQWSNFTFSIEIYMRIKMNEFALMSQI